MTCRILNAWAGVSYDAGSAPGGVSTISLESTISPGQLVVGPAPPRFISDPGGLGADQAVWLTIPHAGLVMAQDDILVADGLIRSFAIWGVHEGLDSAPAVVLRVRLEHDAEITIVKHLGTPARTDIVFPRTALVKVAEGRRIGIDPGHGGKDTGFKGPVNLLEKHIALEVSNQLAYFLEKTGARPVLTRDRDVFVPKEVRLRAIRSGAEMCVEIHASGERDPLKRSYHVRVKPGCSESIILAQSLSHSLTERMGIEFEGIELCEELSVYPMPAVRVEPLCLTYFSDEANYRAPLFRRRMAQSVFNGILRYLAGKVGGGI